MNLLSPEQLAEIRVREQNATQGKWIADGTEKYEPDNWCEDPIIISLPADIYIAQTAYDGLSNSRSHNVVADTLFIANAKQDIPALLDHIEAREQQVKAELQRLLHLPVFAEARAVKEAATRLSIALD